MRVITNSRIIIDKLTEEIHEIMDKYKNTEENLPKDVGDRWCKLQDERWAELRKVRERSLKAGREEPIEEDYYGSYEQEINDN